MGWRTSVIDREGVTGDVVHRVLSLDLSSGLADDHPQLNCVARPPSSAACAPSPLPRRRSSPLRADGPSWWSVTPLGHSMGSPSATMDEGGLRKKNGSDGIALLSSAAWAAKLRLSRQGKGAEGGG